MRNSLAMKACAFDDHGAKKSNHGKQKHWAEDLGQNWREVLNDAFLGFHQIHRNQGCSCPAVNDKVVFNKRSHVDIDRLENYHGEHHQDHQAQHEQAAIDDALAG